MLGVTRWRAGECAEATRALRLDPGQRTIICVAQAKIRGAPEWRDPCHPVVLEQGGDGSLRMVCDRADLRRDDGRQHSSGNKRRKRNDAI